MRAVVWLASLLCFGCGAPPFLLVRVGLADGGERAGCMRVEGMEVASLSWTLPQGMRASAWALPANDQAGISWSTATDFDEHTVALSSLNDGEPHEATSRLDEFGAAVLQRVDEAACPFAAD